MMHSPILKLELQTLRQTVLQNLADHHSEIQAMVEAELERLLAADTLSHLISTEVRRAVTEEVPKVVRSAICSALWRASHEETELGRLVREKVDDVVSKLGQK